jgi:hypothetical protein
MGKGKNLRELVVIVPANNLVEAEKLKYDIDLKVTQIGLPVKKNMGFNYINKCGEVIVNEAEIKYTLSASQIPEPDYLMERLRLNGLTSKIEIR